MKKFVSTILCAALLAGFSACAAPQSTPSAAVSSGQSQPSQQENVFQNYLQAADPAFAYNLAAELSSRPEFFNSELGGRNAGSQAEHVTADYLLEQMNSIGLTQTEKAAADCDLWQFNGAQFTVDGKDYDVYSYATAATPAVTAELVYAGEGTQWDYADLDVKGKIVLVDINQRDNWWITYPMLEARHQGALAILAANTGGFSEIAEDALNSQDICGPVGIPCLSIGLADAKELQAKLQQGPVQATLSVDNIVQAGKGTTYNVMGVLKGKSSEFQTVVGAHYDTHFWGFQDDSCAVGLVLAMAKAMVDSGYVPENDIVFVLHGAEEWGATYTQYDWTVGAWEMIYNLHPEWQDKTLAFINFELPAYEFDTYTSTYSAPEMFTMLDYYANTFADSPQPQGCFPDGVLTEGYQTYTYSDDFSYYTAGVPSTVNGFLLQKDMETVFPFYREIYHTQYDTADTYNENVMRFNLQYYGVLAMYIDQTPALYLDFTAQYQRILDSMDQQTMQAAGVDLEAYNKNLEALQAAATAMKAEVERVNQAYLAAQQSGDAAQMQQLRTQGQNLTRQNLAAFAYAQDQLLGLMYERPIVPHEAPQENIQLAQDVIALLEAGKVQQAVDEKAWQLNNVLEWYAMYFSPEVIDVQDDMLWGADNQDNLYWGTGKSFVKADVESATRSLMQRYEEEGGDFSQEIAVYQAAVAQQQEVLLTLAKGETQSMQTLAQMLELDKM